MIWTFIYFAEFPLFLLVLVTETFFSNASFSLYRLGKIFRNSPIFLLLWDVSACIFPPTLLKSSFSPENTVFFYCRMLLKANNWVSEVLLAILLQVLLGPLCWKKQKLYENLSNNTYEWNYIISKCNYLHQCWPRHEYIEKTLILSHYLRIISGSINILSMRKDPMCHLFLDFLCISVSIDSKIKIVNP